MAYGANFYEPIARAIDGINRQININTQRADDREAAGLQRLLTASQLQTQQESRGLNRRAAERADTQLKETIDANAHTRKIQNANLGFTKATAHRAALNFEAEEGERKAALSKAKQQHTPAPVNVFNFVKQNPRMQNLLMRPQMKALVEAMYNRDFGSVNLDPATGAITSNVNGQPIEMSAYEHANRYAAALDGIVTTALDPQSVIRGDMTQIGSEIASLEGELKASTVTSKGVDGYFKRNAEIKAQLSTLKGRLGRRANTTIDERLDMYDQQRLRMISRYMKAKQAGLSSEVETYFQLGLATNAAMTDRLMKEKEIGMKATKAAVTKGFGPDKWNQVTKNLKSYYGSMDERGQWVKTEAQRLKYKLAESKAKEMIKDGMWHMDAANKAKTEVDQEESKYFEYYEKALAHAGGSHKKAMIMLKTSKMPNGKTVNQMWNARMGYVPEIEAYREKRKKLYGGK